MPAEYIRKTQTYLADKQVADGPILDDFEGAISIGDWNTSGVGGAATYDTAVRLRGLKSLKLVSASPTGFQYDQTLYLRTGGPSVAKQIKAIYNFNPLNMDDRLWYIDFDGGCMSLQTRKYTSWNVRVERTGANEFKIYLADNAGQQLIATLTGSSITNGYFSRLELLIDMSTGKVLTVTLNGVTYDTSAYTPQSFITATYASKQSWLRLIAYQNEDTNPFTCYFDDCMIVDQ